MRQLQRISLPPQVIRALGAYQKGLTRALARERRRKKPEPLSVIEAAWKSHRRNAALESVELALQAMASGLARCMYCEDSHGCDVEHFHPKSGFPTATFDWSNLLWVCTECNRQKNAGFDPLILDPTGATDPLDHLALSFRTGRYTPRGGSPQGVKTLDAIRRLRDDQILSRGRANAWTKIETFLVKYDQLLAGGRASDADEIRKVIVEEPFSAVFAAALNASRMPGAAAIFSAETMRVLAARPEVHGWLYAEDRARAAGASGPIAGAAKRVRLPRP